MMSRLLSWPNLAAALAVLLFIALGSAGCASAPPLPEAQPMPAGKDFTGVWFSPQFEHMNLRQSGDRVAGVYTYREGGRIEGTVEGNMLRFTWIEPGKKETATRTMKGSGYLQLVVEPGEYEEVNIVGEWGYNDDLTGGGPWSAEYVRELLPDDPLTLENLERSR